jgi:hypothetical protein
MTVILSYRSSAFIFLAADSCRWDFILQKNLGPIVKLHSPFDGSAFAVGGQNIDRTEFAKQMVTARQNGSDYLAAARSIAPQLFAENLAKQKELGVQQPQRLISWYAEGSGEVCTLTLHELPVDESREIDGLSCMGPDSVWLQQYAIRCLDNVRSADGNVEWDAWAYEVLREACQRFPTHVAFPAIATMIRADGSHRTRNDLHPSAWRGPDPEFRRKIT